ESVVFAYNGKLAVEYLRGGLHPHLGLEHHHHATNTDASPDPSPANPDQYLL
ncbi:hypothetical protein K0M31_000475, partial [Melipona bicolor]